jgi:transcriptional regulator with XRE-family HTH domain
MKRNDLLVRFGDAVRAAREKKCVSQEELAAKAGLHRTYIGGVERGERNLGLRNVFRIAEALGCQPSSLIVAVERRQGK